MAKYPFPIDPARRAAADKAINAWFVFREAAEEAAKLGISVYAQAPPKSKPPRWPIEHHLGLEFRHDGRVGAELRASPIKEQWDA